MKLSLVVLVFLSMVCFGTLAGCGFVGRPPLSPLIIAAREGNTERIAELVASGADVNTTGGVNDWTPLLHAIHKNQAGSVRTLLAAGANVAGALPMAAGYGYADIVRLLLDHGAAPNVEALDAALNGAFDIDRFTYGHCQPEVVNALLEKKPELRLTSESKLRSCKGANIH